MKILITGATGFVGKRLARRLFQAGHEIIVLSRNPEKAKELFGIPCDVYQWDPINELAPEEAIKSADGVINLMGENISAGRWTSKQKEKISQSRFKGTQNLVQSINQRDRNLDFFISTSAIGIYKKNLGSKITEKDELDSDFLANVCKDWEKAAEACEKANRKVIIRTGVVFGEEGGALSKLLPLFKLGLGGPIGFGKAVMSWIHIDDLVEIYFNSSTKDKYKGVYNAVAPNSVSNKEFTQILAKNVGIPALMPVPPIMLKLIFGEMSKIILDSQIVLPENLLSIGHTFIYPDLNEALTQICSKQDQPELKGLQRFESYQFIPSSLNEVFSFFSNPQNLNKITPPDLNFSIRQMSTSEIQEGALIDYEFSKYGIPLKWKTLISKWEPNKMFVDEQLKGPYQVWHHTHAFYPLNGGTLIHDTVLYKLPLGIIGHFISLVIVNSDIKQIFNFRKKVIETTFN